MLPNLMALGPFLMLWTRSNSRSPRKKTPKRFFANVFTYLWFIEIFMALCICAGIRDLIN